MNSLISVVVPIYNAEDTLERCIESIVGQTYSNLQIILVNDGSIDASLSICERYAALDTRITTVDSINQGVSAARNLGLSRAIGTYYGFVDADDWIEPSHFEELAKGFDFNSTSCLSVVGVVAESWERYLDALCEESEMCVLSNEQAMDEITKEYGLRGYLWNKLFLTTPIRLDSAFSVCEDLEFVVRYLSLNKNQSVSVINACTYHYIVPVQQHFSVRRYNYARLYTRLLAYDSIIGFVPDHLVGRIKSYQCYYAYEMLVAWYNQPKIDKSADNRRRDRIDEAERYFYTTYTYGLNLYSTKYRLKFRMFRYVPGILISLLRLKQALGITIPERSGSR